MVQVPHFVGRRYYFPFRPGEFNSKWMGSSSDFGERTSPISDKIVSHGGIDVGAPVGTPVMAIGNGTVRKLRLDHASAGTYIEIEHPDGHWSRYLHLSKPMVSEGDVVGSEEVIGLSGGQPGAYGAGSTTAPHLHLEIWQGQPWGKTPDGLKAFRVDPVPLLYDAREPSLLPAMPGQAKWVGIALLTGGILVLGDWLRKS